MKMSGRIYIRLTPVTATVLSNENRGAVEALEKREVYCFCRESSSGFFGCPARSLVSVPT